MLDVWPWDGDRNEVRTALAEGRILAIPTESSYGLAVDPRSTKGVEAIYRFKERERGKPLPVVAADLDQALGLGIEPNEAIRMAGKHTGRRRLPWLRRYAQACPCRRPPVETHWPCECRTMTVSVHSSRPSVIRSPRPARIAAASRQRVPWRTSNRSSATPADWW